MNDADSILILSACTATKTTTDSGRLLIAEELYAGQQHRRLMRGVGAYRAAGEPSGPLKLQILSAGHGVVAADRALSRYDATFAGMPRAQLRRRAARLGVPKAVANLLAQPRRLAVLLLGEDYLHAAQLAPSVELGAPTLVFTSPRAEAQLPALPLLHPIALDNRDARRLSCGLVALKGELGTRLLLRLVENPGWQVPVDRGQLLSWLEAIPEDGVVRSLQHDFAHAA
jgi:hypothetical protein